MANIPKNILEIIIKYIQELSKEISIDKVIILVLMLKIVIMKIVILILPYFQKILKILL